MDESTPDHTHPPSCQQAAVGGSRASSKATHVPSAKLWKQVNVHRTLRPLLGPPRARSLQSTSLPYGRYVGGPDGPACTVSSCPAISPSSPLREHGVRILNYLDDWLILAQSQDQLCEHRDWCSRTSASWAFRSTGKRANSC